MKYKIGDGVKVVKRIRLWDGPQGMWISAMDTTLDKYFTIFQIGESGYLLNTKICTGIRFNYWYSADSFDVKIGEQLVFDFMKE